MFLRSGSLLVFIRLPPQCLRVCLIIWRFSGLVYLYCVFTFAFETYSCFLVVSFITLSEFTLPEVKDPSLSPPDLNFSECLSEITVYLFHRPLFLPGQRAVRLDDLCWGSLRCDPVKDHGDDDWHHWCSHFSHLWLAYTIFHPSCPSGLCSPFLLFGFVLVLTIRLTPSSVHSISCASPCQWYPSFWSGFAEGLSSSPLAHERRVVFLCA